VPSRFLTYILRFYQDYLGLVALFSACVWLCLFRPPAFSSRPTSPTLLLFILVFSFFFYFPGLNWGIFGWLCDCCLAAWLLDRLLHHLTQRRLPRSIVLLPIPAAQLLLGLPLFSFSVFSFSVRLYGRVVVSIDRRWLGSSVSERLAGK